MSTTEDFCRTREIWLTKKDISVHMSRARVRFPRAKDTAVITVGPQVAKRLRSPASATTKLAGRRLESSHPRDAKRPSCLLNLRQSLSGAWLRGEAIFTVCSPLMAGLLLRSSATRIVRELSRLKSNSACGPPIRPANKEAIPWPTHRLR